VTIEIELAGTRRTIDVRREGDRWIVTREGRRMMVDLAEAGGRWSVVVGEESYEVSIEPGAPGGQVVHVNGHAVPLSIIDPRTAFRRRGRDGGMDRGRSATVVAPMPGRVVKVLVKPGDLVVGRQPLVVVEAMKMENELRAPRAGTVTEVRVSEGMSVEAHSVLVVVE
jgi:biotin carboxyl carrier protein